jgi:AraC family transcriptional activator of pobA
LSVLDKNYIFMEYIQTEKDVHHEFFIRKLDDESILDIGTTRLYYHHIFVLENASGTLSIDGQTIELQPLQVLLMAKGQIISSPKDLQLKGYEIAFTDAFWEKAPQSASNCKSVLFDQQAVNHILPLSEDEFKELNMLLPILKSEFSKNQYNNKTDVLAAYLKVLMIKIANINFSMEERYNDFYKKTYAEFLELVSSQYQNNREVAGYAKKLNISTRQLNDLCSRQSGESPKKIINLTIINEAKRFLQFTAVPIKEIASVFNFSGTDQFSHFFKKETSFSPQKYREHHAGFDMRKG